MKEKLFLSVATLLGVIIGAGIFTLPYAISKAGVLPSLFYFLLLGTTTLFVNLFLGEATLRTKGKRRLVGLAKIYLGEKAKILLTICVILSTIGTLLAYIIIEGEFLRIVTSPFFKASSFYLSLFSWLILTFFVFKGIRLIARAEFLTNLGFFLVIFLILFFCAFKFTSQNLPFFNSENLFLPYGLILFAFAGAGGVLEITEVLRTPEERKEIPKVIVFTQIVVFLLYVALALLIAGVSGKNTSKEALSGLALFLGKEIVFLGSLAGAVTLADSFLIAGLYLRNTLIFDFKFSKILAVCFSCGIPFALFLVGFKDFIEVIALVGAVLGAIEGVLIILIFKKAKKLGERKPEYEIKIPSFLIYILMLIFVIGGILEILT